MQADLELARRRREVQARQQNEEREFELSKLRIEQQFQDELEQQRRQLTQKFQDDKQRFEEEKRKKQLDI
jgi:hypothetical protein